MKLISDFKRSPFVIIAEETRIYCRDVEYSLFSQKCSKTFEEPHSLLSLKFINRLVIIEKTGARRSRRVAFEVLVTRSRVRERCDAMRCRLQINGRIRESVRRQRLRDPVFSTRRAGKRCTLHRDHCADRILCCMLCCAVLC